MDSNASMGSYLILSYEDSSNICICICTPDIELPSDTTLSCPLLIYHRLSGQFVTYPLDVVRRRMQMATKNVDGKMSSLRYDTVRLTYYCSIILKKEFLKFLYSIDICLISELTIIITFIYFCRVTLISLISTEGVRGLGKGFSLNIMKGPITLSISLTTYDLLTSYFHLKKIH